MIYSIISGLLIILFAIINKNYRDTIWPHIVFLAIVGVSTFALLQSPFTWIIWLLMSLNAMAIYGTVYNIKNKLWPKPSIDIDPDFPLENKIFDHVKRMNKKITYEYDEENETYSYTFKVNWKRFNVYKKDYLYGLKISNVELSNHLDAELLYFMISECYEKQQAESALTIKQFITKL